MDTTKISKIIKALSVKTVENGCSEDEALAASEKVQILLNKYNLSLSEVEFEASDFEELVIDTKIKKRNHMHRMISSIADFTDTKVFYTHGMTTLKYKYFGEKASVETANFLWDLLKNSIEYEAKRYKNSNAYDEYIRCGYSGRTILNSFRTGMAVRLSQRLDEMKEEQEKSNSSETGIVLYNRKNIVIKKWNEHYKNLKLNSGKTYKTSITGGAFNSGKSAADRVNINSGVKSSTYNQKSLC